MSSSQLVLDTDILSLLMRNNSSVIAKANEYLSEHDRFTISIITRYEILRGLKQRVPINRHHASKISARRTKFSPSRTMSSYGQLISMPISISGDLELLKSAVAENQQHNIKVRFTPLGSAPMLAHYPHWLPKEHGDFLIRQMEAAEKKKQET